jgi:hypothetical protein
MISKAQAHCLQLLARRECWGDRKQRFQAVVHANCFSHDGVAQNQAAQRMYLR